MVTLLTLILAVHPASQTCVPGPQYMRSGCTYGVVTTCPVYAMCVTDLECWAEVQNMGRRACLEWEQELPPDGRALAASMLFEEIREAMQFALTEASQ